MHRKHIEKIYFDISTTNDVHFVHILQVWYLCQQSLKLQHFSFNIFASADKKYKTVKNKNIFLSGQFRK